MSRDRVGGRDLLAAAALAVAIGLQGIGLVVMGRLAVKPAVQLLVVTVALALTVAQAWRVRLRLNHRIDMLLVMGAFGGLGMIAGWWIDLDFKAPPADASFHAAMGHACDHSAAGSETGEPVPPCHAAAAANGDETAPAQQGGSPFWSMALSWMTGLMLAFAIPPGVVMTRCAELARSGWRLWISTHIIGNAAMVVGMIVIGHWIGPAIGRLVHSNVVGAHVGMLLGMLVGMEAGMLGGEALLGLKPWQEWRWEGEAAGDG